MIIPCGVRSEGRSYTTESIWTFNPEDPWVFELSFVDQEAVWDISLEMVTEALTGLDNRIHGYMDVQVEVCGGTFYLHLTNGDEGYTITFPTEKVEDFINEIDTSNAEMVVGNKLDEFLNAL